MCFKGVHLFKYILVSCLFTIFKIHVHLQNTFWLLDQKCMFLVLQPFELATFDLGHHVFKKYEHQTVVHFPTVQDIVLKFQDFSVFQISCEINFGESRTSKTLNFVDLIDFGLQKVQNSINSQNSESLNVLKWHFFNFQNSQN